MSPSAVAENFADAGRSAESLLPKEEPPAGGEVEDVRQQTPSMLQSPENPIRDLEEACARSPNFTPASKVPKQVITDIPAIQEPSPSSYDDDDESSDSWTGDDEFLPRSARRQKRIDRKASPQPKNDAAATKSSTQLLRPQAPSYRSPNYPCPSPIAKPSRFRAEGPLVTYREYRCVC